MNLIVLFSLLLLLTATAISVRILLEELDWRLGAASVMLGCMSLLRLYELWDTTVSGVYLWHTHSDWIVLALALAAPFALLAFRRTLQRQRELAVQVRSLLKTVIEGQDAQSEFASREVHEVICQDLAIVKWRLEDFVRTAAQTSDLQAQGSAIAADIQKVLGIARNFSQSLSPGALKPLGISGALRELAGKIQETGTNVILDLQCIDAFFEGGWNSAVYRVVAEGADILRACSPAPRTLRISTLCVDDQLRMRIQDDAAGERGAVDVSTVEFQILAERVHMLGGSLDIESGAGGAALSVTIPRTAGKSGSTEEA